MNLQGLHDFLRAEPSFRRIAQSASQPFEQRSEELEIAAPQGMRAILGAHAAEGLIAGNDQALMLIVTATGREAEEVSSSLTAYMPKSQIAEFPSWETLPHERLSPRSDTVGQRLEVLRRINDHDPQLKVIIAPIRAVLQPLVAGLGQLKPVELELDAEPGFEKVIKDLAAAAYARVDMVTHRGEFAVRGGIIDLFPPTLEHPVRIDFFGEQIDSMRYFSIADQRSLEHAGPRKIIATPCREMLITPQVMSRAANLKAHFPAATEMLTKIAGGIAVEGMESLAPLLVDQMVPLLSLLPQSSIALVMEPERVRTRAHDLNETNAEFLAAAWASASDGANAPLDLSTAESGRKLASGDFASLAETVTHAKNAGISWWSLTTLGADAELDLGTAMIRVEAREPRGYQGDVEAMMEFISGRVKDQWRIVVATEGPGPAARLSELFAEYQIPAHRVESLTEAPSAGLIEITQATAGRGFVFDSLKFGLLTEADLLGRSSAYGNRKTRKLSAKRKRNAVDPLSLQNGDYIVHEQHGIGKFVELVARKVAGSSKDAKREYLVVEYAPSKRGAPGDRLFVPMEQLDLVTRYVGGEAPSMSKMGGSDWASTKSKARKAVKEIAGDLIKLYSARMASRGHAFGPDTPWQNELEEAFAYVETPDQLTAINEVKQDMEREVPMDRLISGDVGFGKTEIAVRSAFKAVQDSKQVAVLVPTTLLASQHQQTFTERYSGFPLRVRTLSRFQTAKESKEILAGLKDGSVDIVIGTHRLLSKTVEFKNLGLVIIDEEQRFGVEHKEELKKMRTNVDVLAMSATPIPRTLEMSLTGIRETSTLATPPEERHPVLTFVGPRSDKQISAAIKRELMRDGQVFFVHNRVSSIDRVAAELRELVPEARVEVAHGKMSESRLERIIQDFWEKKFDVLVSTTIIETGLDISNANTLIVDRANNYGLSQLHQLRGRVGRARERAYAYFLWDVEKPLGEVALERLKAVAAHNELGSGYQLAMKDLELRGAGNMLGGEQSGHIAGVGFDLYLRLVGEAVADFKGEGEEEATEMKIELPVNAHLPHEYVPGERLRLEAYRNIAAAETAEALSEVRAELEDRYGKIPLPVENLLRVAALRVRARAVGLRDIQQIGNHIKVSPAKIEDLPASRQVRLERLYPGAANKPALHAIFIPKPRTSPVGGKDLADEAILEWAERLLYGIFEPAPVVPDTSN